MFTTSVLVNISIQRFSKPSKNFGSLHEPNLFVIFTGFIVMILHCEDQHKNHVNGVKCVSTKAKIPQQKTCVSNRPCAASEILNQFYCPPIFPSLSFKLF